ncbi:PREDICTED: deleted in lung and esophageal cancer protein 1 [Nanorana parkeri]|uniref:deleted in lung and esophageal cancer protein 1 n=1 Tax=Nanorana parkeri TaxID=125878 RepID=UPI000854B4BB|nr:PREDICTED: deleted in lung and esophageal cancer protein 1 [Nanorana parkeri]
MGDSVSPAGIGSYSTLLQLQAGLAWKRMTIEEELTGAGHKDKMSTEEILHTVTQSPDPAMYWPRPSSEKTQDISHLLTSLFKNVYTGEIIGKDTGANLIRSKGGDNPHHQKFVEELQQIRAEYDHRLAESDMVEHHIIQARARAMAEEERILNCMKNEAEDTHQNLGLPPVQSYFRWCVNNDLLKKHKLISPEDYITDVHHSSKAPRGFSDPSFYKETFSFHQHISRSPVDDGYCDPAASDIAVRDILKASSSNLTLLSTCDKSTPKKSLQKTELSAEDREAQRTQLAKLEKRHNFLKNPRFLPPNSLHGGRSLILPTKKGETLISGRKRVIEEHDPNEPIPVFLANPPVIFFPEYEIGQIYEMTVELRNMTASSRHVRIIPPSTAYFSVGLGKFPGEGGIVAPGMSCHYTVRFVPDSLADFEDFILVESQAPYPVLVPIEARRPPPVLTLPRILDCGPCLVGGVKVFECLCRNEGLNRGRFCIMPKSVWPPANFRSIATAGFVEQAPFGIHPAMFELYPGQETVIEVVFYPTSLDTYSEDFTIVCDNCQIKDLTLTGYGQLVGLELVSVSEGKSISCPDGPTDAEAEHSLCFPSTNLHSTVQKNIVIRNTTHVELPFYWQIMKPTFQDLQPGETVDVAKIRNNIDTNPAFMIIPVQGILQPHQDHMFTVMYTPTELIEYHSVAQMVLSDIPENPSAKKHPLSISELAPALNDVIVLDLEFKGTTEPFHIVLEPYAIIFSGENFIDTNMRKRFIMWNNSISSVQFEWDTITSPNIIQIEPHNGTIEPGKFCEFELIITGLQSGSCRENVNCHILHSLEPVVLHVEANFKGPVVSIAIPSIDLGLIKLGNKILSTFTIENMSSLAAKWKMCESRACLTERGVEDSQFSITPDSGVLAPLCTAQVSVLFKPLTCQRLNTVLELKVENSEGSYLPVVADVQVPQACLISSCLVFPEIYVGVPAQSTVKMFNQGRLPASFSWEELTDSHSMIYSATVTPPSGLLGPNEEAEVCVTLILHTLDELNDVALCCRVEDMKDPLVLNLKAKARGLHVTYSLPDGEESLKDTAPSSPQELQLDFGSDVVLQSKVQRTLILTNHTGISAPFSIQALYFTGCPLPQVSVSKNSTVSVMQRSARFAEEAARRAEADTRALILSNEKGAAFIAQPCSGILGPFHQISIDVIAYNNMWGEYSDHLVCTVGDLNPKEIPLKMTVKGCPLYFQMTGPRPNRQTEGPALRFGTHVSGGDTISRCLRINNPSPFDIRLDWETYNREEDSSKLVDLVLLYGDPFPLKDIDGNEIVDSSIDTPESGSSSQDWDKIPSTSGSSVSLRSPSHINGMEQIAEAEEVSDNHDDREREFSPEQKLISVVLRPHEGVASDYPYCITPRQTIVPAGGYSSIHVSFTPLMLSGVTKKVECSGYALGFLNLDDKSAKLVPGRVKRQHGYGVEPIKIELQAFVKPALLTVEVEEDDEEGLVFYSVASDLIPNKKTSPILTDIATTRNMKLINCTETPLYFRLLLSNPFSVSAIDPNKSVRTSQSDREDRGEQIVLHPQQNTLVKLSFCTTLELLTYQHLPEDQMLPGVKLLQSENGERRLHFSQQLLIEYSNNSTQQVALSAYITVPVLQLSSDTVDFGTCFVGQTRTREVFLLNKSGSKSYWTALLDKQERHSKTEVFSISPTSGVLEAHVSHTSASKEMLLVTFTARTNTDYETAVTVHGMLGEKPQRLIIRGRGSYDEKYEALLNA